jgi:hypothetical protein
LIGCEFYSVAKRIWDKTLIAYHDLSMLTMPLTQLTTA